MSKITISSYETLKEYEGKELGVSDYLTITQDQINKFADATLDHQWIHVDQERATKESPFGGTIAHGYLTMCLAAYFVPQILEVPPTIKLVVNYGINSLRFMTPVKVNSKLRARVALLSAKNLRGTIKTELKVTFELEGSTKPAAVAEIVFLYQF